VNDNRTAEFVLRVRITAVPDSDMFAEYDVQRFRVGDVYELPVRLATLLMISGYAESAVGVVLPATEAADFSGRKPRPKKKT
jgi:hypothetical protein